ncbi:hypothetical protein JZ751_002438, partial [Albula glossodonta]
MTKVLMERKSRHAVAVRERITRRLVQRMALSSADGSLAAHRNHSRAVIGRGVASHR